MRNILYKAEIFKIKYAAFIEILEGVMLAF